MEIKARLASYQTQFDLAETLCGGGGERIHQVDHFFNCQRGRLKLRLFDEGHGELIFYQRDNQTGPKLSDYVLARTDQPTSLREALGRAYGELATIEKERTLFLWGRTRIHLDRVRGLGDFLELEVVLGQGEEVSAGEREAAELMEKLAIGEDTLIESAYVDLMAVSLGCPSRESVSLGCPSRESSIGTIEQQ
jgi:predicted adenylyl cyclase CyaB